MILNNLINYFKFSYNIPYFEESFLVQFLGLAGWSEIQYPIVSSFCLLVQEYLAPLHLSAHGRVYLTCGADAPSKFLAYEISGWLMFQRGRAGWNVDRLSGKYYCNLIDSPL
jgi:hypothetical protein